MQLQLETSIEEGPKWDSLTSEMLKTNELGSLGIHVQYNVSGTSVIMFFFFYLCLPRVSESFSEEKRL